MLRIQRRSSIGVLSLCQRFQNGPYLCRSLAGGNPEPISNRTPPPLQSFCHGSKDQRRNVTSAGAALCLIYAPIESTGIEAVIHLRAKHAGLPRFRLLTDWSRLATPLSRQSGSPRELLPHSLLSILEPTIPASEPTFILLSIHLL